MDDILKFGLANDVFAPEDVMDLLYGSLRYDVHKDVKTNQEEEFCEWYGANRRSFENWGRIPLEQRREIVTLILEKGKNSYYRGYHYFHDRILCLLHYLLNDDENKVECIAQYPWGQNTEYKHKFYVLLSVEQESIASFEMFLWYKAGLKKTPEERKLLRQVWKKFLGCDNIKSSKQLKELAEKEIIALEAKHRNLTRKVKYNDALIDRYFEEKKAIKKRRFSKAKREKLLQQLKAKDSAAHHRFWRGRNQLACCRIALNFLNGYLDFLKIS